MKLHCLPILNIGMSGRGEISPVQLTIDYTATQFVFKFKLPSTKSVTLHWGDGTSETVVGQDATLITKTSSYATPDTYYFYVEGDWADITYLWINKQSFVSGLVDRWGELSSLADVNIAGTGLSGNINTTLQNNILTYFAAGYQDIQGDISLFAGCLDITNIIVANCSFYGDVSALNVLESLTYLRASRSDLTFSSNTAWSSTLDGRFIKIDDCNFSSADVDRIIDAFKSLVGSGINIGGNNGERTSASDSNLAVLLGNGTTITLNEISNIGTLGPELYDLLNAASDNSGNETDATTGWSQTGLTTGGNIFESQSLIKATGDFAIKAESNDTPVANSSMSTVVTVVAASIYRLGYKWRHVGIGQDWSLWLDGVQQHVTVDYLVDDFLNQVTYYTAPDNSMELKVREQSPTNDGGVYFDDLSVKKLTLPA